ncbi:MAG TPA: phospholipase D family protein [Ktedonobacteraceae bacterium]|nr:phospholipase D family protein [Ktedonobacteraceae bacterium]
MPDTTISFIDEPLNALLKAGKDYPNSDIDLSVAYVSSIGVSWLQTLFKSANRVRAVVGLCPINRVNAFVELQDYGVEVYVYVAGPGKIFHPKIYYGATNAQAWAMVGSSNLTQKGLSINIERNLFIAGQRLTEPFTAIEAQLGAFRSQAYPFDDEIRKRLREVEKKMNRSVSEDEYVKRLIEAGFNPKTKIGSSIPTEVQQVALETVLEFAKNTRLEYSYQMLLLLVMLYRTDENGQIPVEDAARCFSQFYKLRKEAGLSVEKKKALRSAVVDKADLNPPAMSRIVKIDPFPRFERRGLLDLSEDGKYFIVNPALLTVLTPQYRAELRSLAIGRLAEHYEESLATIDALITVAIC